MKKTFNLQIWSYVIVFEHTFLQKLPTYNTIRHLLLKIFYVVVQLYYSSDFSYVICWKICLCPFLHLVRGFLNIILDSTWDRNNEWLLRSRRVSFELSKKRFNQVRRIVIIGYKAILPIEKLPGGSILPREISYIVVLSNNDSS